MGSNREMSDRERLADHLSKCATEDTDAHLTPELIVIALQELRAFVAKTSYQIETVTGEGSVTILSVVNDPKILLAAYDAAVAQAPRHTVQIRRGTEFISIDEALGGADDCLRADRLGAST
jgi:hypothetical protein